LVDAWEVRDHEKHSYPQISTTPQIESALKKWRQGIHLGPPVPFAPARVKRSTDDLTAFR